MAGLERFTKWVAQYYSKCEYTGAHLDIWQYSSKGSVPGINGNVDMNECYRDFPAEILEKKKKTVEELAREVIGGVWDNGDARKEKLTSAGYDYEAVQSRVNSLLRREKG